MGVLREQLVVQCTDAPALRISSLIRAATTATATTVTPHGFVTTDYVTVAGATPTGYNGKVKVTVIDTVTFTFPVSGSVSTPATGTMTATYTSNARGGSLAPWRTLVTIRAEMIPLKSSERLQLAAIQSDTTYRFRARIRPDLAVAMRLLWTPSRNVAGGQRTLAITGIIPDDRLRYQFLEAAEVAA